MTIRFATLIIASLLVAFTAAAHAKVSPGLETRGQSRDQMLQQLINQPQGGNTCEVGQVRGFGDVGKVAIGLTLGGKRNDSCPIPAPSPNPFGNVASL